MRNCGLLVGLVAVALAAVGWNAPASAESLDLYVDATRGKDAASGKEGAPLKTIGAAIERLPRVIGQEVTIHLAPGRYAITGGKGRDAKRLELNRPMREGVRVKIKGARGSAGSEGVVLDWANRSSRFMIVVTRGHWALENVQLGTRKATQRHGISVAGPALLEVRDVRIRTRSFSGPGLHAHHGGRIHLYGTIELNEDLHEDRGEEESFCGIVAEYFGTVRFRQRKGASLSMGNGNLDVRTYGIIELGCERARITSWGEQSNVIAVNDSGRIGFRNTTTTICAQNPRNTPIGLEHDGHVMAEGARIIILGRDNHSAIVLQKASSFFCNDVEIRGRVRQALTAYSGSTLLVGVLGDLGGVRATTGSRIIVEKCTGSLVGPVTADKMGQVLLPDGKVVVNAQVAQKGEAHPGSEGVLRPPTVDPATLPSLHRAAYGGHADEVLRLIERGADVRARGPNGWTALHVAAMRGHKQVVRALLTKGADAGARDDKGRTPADLAEVSGHTATGVFLRQKESRGD